MDQEDAKQYNAKRDDAVVRDSVRIEEHREDYKHKQSHAKYPYHTTTIGEVSFSREGVCGAGDHDHRTTDESLKHDTGRRSSVVDAAARKSVRLANGE
jgi:hypothetical protein